MQKDPNRKLVAFIDEFGDSGLNFKKGKTSSHFIVTAIIMEQDMVETAKQKLDSIRKNYFQGSEIKSSSVKNKQVDRRLIILKKLCEIEFSIFAVVVDKQQLTSKGFQYHDSFFKFCNRLVHDELYATFPNLDIIADTHGGNKFIQSFIRYVNEHQVLNDLFNHSSFQMSDSEEYTLIQIADFIGGTIAKGYDKTVFSSDSPKYNDVIKSHISKIVEWPFHYRTYSYKPEKYSDFDDVIADYAARAAERYIEKYRRANDVNTLNRIRVLEYLLFNFQHISPRKFILTKELMKLTKYPMQIQNFRSDVIASLRDDGVIIASSDKGYKIPMNAEDIYGFVKRKHSVNPV